MIIKLKKDCTTIRVKIDFSIVNNRLDFKERAARRYKA